MNLRIYLGILRLRTLGLIVFFFWFLAFMFAFCTQQASHREGAYTFLILAILGPIATGCALSQAIHEPFHWPMAILLPRLGQCFREVHIFVIGTLALVFAAFGHLWDAQTPPVVVASFAAAGLSLSLPLESRLLWYGSHRLALSVIGLIVLATLYTHELRMLAQTSPWTASLFGTGLCAMCFALGFSRQRLRARASQPLGMMMSDYFDRAALEDRQKEAIARSRHLGRQWRHGPVGSSTMAWVRVGWHEHFGYRRVGWFGMILIISLSWPVLEAVIEKISGSPVSIAARIYYLVWDSQGPRDAGPSFLIILMLVASISLGGFLRPDQIYPISRARRAWVAYVSSATLAVTFCASLVVLTLPAAWLGAHVAGIDFRPAGMPFPVLAVFVTLPVLPLLQWGGLYMAVRQDKMVHSLFVLIGFTGSALLGIFIHNFPKLIISPVGLLVGALAIAGSQRLYYTALRRFYCKGDLLQRGTNRQNFGLV